AGRSLARLVAHLAPRSMHSPVIVLAGTGGNGGGALVAARRLVGWGFSVEVMTTRPGKDYVGVTAHQLAILDRLEVTISSTGSPGPVSPDAIVVDGLIGYSLSGPPHGRSADLIRWANARDAATIALDVPSGFSTASGSISEPAIIAHATLTLALPKKDLARHRGNVGTLYCADIGVPAALYDRAFGLEIGDLFHETDIVEVLAVPPSV
ncbi:MAG: NAD(P)H-hydrate epimerase, partial [Proteobacteria bacterium]|nr:NAD(P)H-hydrate epimerase [Pseudomonadota bacterium]